MPSLSFSTRRFKGLRWVDEKGWFRRTSQYVKEGHIFFLRTSEWGIRRSGLPALSFFSNVLSNMQYIEQSTQVSDEATRILVNLLSDGEDAWTIEKPTRNEILKHLVTVLNSRDLNTQRHVRVTSFEPCFRLLRCDHIPEVQYWAIWTLANFINHSRKHPALHILNLFWTGQGSERSCVTLCQHIVTKTSIHPINLQCSSVLGSYTN